jgi:hypothetical protein
MPSTSKATSKPAGKKLTKAQEAKVAAVLGKDALANEAAHKISEEQRHAERRATPPRNAMDFAVQQLSAPVAPAVGTPPVLSAEFLAAKAELEAKFGIQVTPASAKASKVKAEKIQQNEVTRPATSTLCGKIWAAADAISAEIHGVCPIALLKGHEDVKGVNDHTIKTQYARWRQFNGVSGRLPKIHAVHQVAGQYEGVPEVK